LFGHFFGYLFTGFSRKLSSLHESRPFDAATARSHGTSPEQTWGGRPHSSAVRRSQPVDPLGEVPSHLDQGHAFLLSYQSSSCSIRSIRPKAVRKSKHTGSLSRNRMVLRVWGPCRHGCSGGDSRLHGSRRTTSLCDRPCGEGGASMEGTHCQGVQVG